MAEKVKVVSHIEYVKSYKNLTDFATSLYLNTISSCNWTDGYFFILGHSHPPVSLDPTTVFIAYDGFAYFKGKYTPYIIINTEDDGMHAMPAKKIDPKDTTKPSIRVDHVEPYEFGDLRKVIMQTISNVEKAKNEFKIKKKQ